jgi:hypothetical protein
MGKSGACGTPLLNYFYKKLMIQLGSPDCPRRAMGMTGRAGERLRA